MMCVIAYGADMCGLSSHFKTNSFLGGRPPGVPSLDSERLFMLQARILRVILSAFGQEWLGRHTLPFGHLGTPWDKWSSSGEGK